MVTFEPCETIQYLDFGSTITVMLSTSAKENFTRYNGIIRQFFHKAFAAEGFRPVIDERLPSREDFDLYLRLNMAGIPIFKADSINATIECRRTLRELLRQRAWYRQGEILLRQKYGEGFMRKRSRDNIYQTLLPLSYPYPFISRL